MTQLTSARGRVVLSFMQETLDYIASLENRVVELESEVETLKGDTMPHVLNADFIAEYTGVSRSTVGDWLNRKIIKAKKEGGRWLIKRDDFMAWLNDDEKPQRLARVK